jgi:hypothetical protein
MTEATQINANTVEFAVFWVLCHVVWWPDTNILEDHAAFIFRVGFTSALKMEAAQSSETASNHHTTWNNNPETHEFYFHCHENLKYHKRQYKANEILVR